MIYKQENKSTGVESSLILVSCVSPFKLGCIKREELRINFIDLHTRMIL